jgi:hypothetical protein
MDQISLQTHQQIKGEFRFMVIDEVASVKKGFESVSVSWQWCEMLSSQKIFSLASLHGVYHVNALALNDRAKTATPNALTY